MSKTKIAITLDSAIVKRLDQLIEERAFPNRSRAIERAVQEKLELLRKTRLARECAKLDPRAEQAMAETGLGQDAEEWPEY